MNKYEECKVCQDGHKQMYDMSKMRLDDIDTMLCQIGMLENEITELRSSNFNLTTAVFILSAIIFVSIVLFIKITIDGFG